MRVYLRDRQKRRVVDRRQFELVSRHRAARIYAEEIEATPRKWVMLFRDSMTTDIDRFAPDTAATLIYSLWPGYLDRDGGRLASWCRRRAIALEVAHTSGHADHNRVRLAQALDPRIVVPIHTQAPQVMAALVRNVGVMRDGDWLEV